MTQVILQQHFTRLLSENAVQIGFRVGDRAVIDCKHAWRHRIAIAAELAESE